jgi:hypothetical protein
VTGSTTISRASLADPGRGRWPADRLGLAVALCTLPWLASAPAAAVARLAGQLQVDPMVIGVYGRRAKTRTDHLRLAAQYLGWRAATALELKELDEFLLARAMEHDSPTLLFRLACEYLISAKVIRPGPVSVVKRVAHAREVARRETFEPPTGTPRDMGGHRSADGGGWDGPVEERCQRWGARVGAGGRAGDGAGGK